MTLMLYPIKNQGKLSISGSIRAHDIGGFPHHSILALPDDLLLPDLREAQGQVQRASLGRGPKAHVDPLACCPFKAFLYKQPADAFALVFWVDDQEVQPCARRVGQLMLLLFTPCSRDDLLVRFLNE